MIGFPVQSKGLHVEDNTSISDDILLKTLGKVVVHHQSIIQISDHFEELFNFMILAIFVVDALILCFLMYHASIVSVLSQKCNMF